MNGFCVHSLHLYYQQLIDKIIIHEYDGQFVAVLTIGLSNKINQNMQPIFLNRAHGCVCDLCSGPVDLA